MPHLRYIGPVSPVDVPLLGRELTRGDVFEVDDDTAKILALQPDLYYPADSQEG